MSKIKMNIFSKIKSLFTANKYFAVIIYDGYKHYISSNIFTSHREAKRWISIFNESSMSAKAIDIFQFKTKNKLINKINS